MSSDRWPALREQDRWLIAAMEARLFEATQSLGELRTRARELRADAERTDIKGVRDASIALAERYEETAAARLGAR